MLTVSDVAAAVAFYQKAFGFTKRVVMKGPDGKPMHAELKLRDTVLMLGPECAERERFWLVTADPSTSCSPTCTWITSRDSVSSGPCSSRVA